MKRYTILIILLMILMIGVQPVYATSETPKEYKIVYFYSPTCTVCQSIEPYIDGITDIQVEKISVVEGNGLQVFNAYIGSYEVPSKYASAPMVFAGNSYFHGDDIIGAIQNGDILEAAQNPLLPVNIHTQTLGFFGILFGGLIDGFNPCAIAILLLFISLLGFTEKKKLLIIVSLTYISALFISYFALGTVLFSVFDTLSSHLRFLTSFINWFILILCLILFILNLYDFFATRNEEYGKVKNQLPKAVQKMNKKIISKFSSVLNDSEKSKYTLVVIVVLTLLLGFIISFTEFLCTGQIYLPIILDLVQFSGTLNIRAIFYLLIYNVMFVSPLIVIALIAIKSKSTVSVSNFIREHMQFIKLMTALLFLGIFVFYIFRIFLWG